MDKTGQRYLKRLRRALICSREDRERLLADAEALLENFSQENPRAFYRDYIASFGPPENFAAEMLSCLDPEDVAGACSRRKRILLGVLAVAGALLVLLAGFWFGRQSLHSLPKPSQPAEADVLKPAPDAAETPGRGGNAAVDYVERTFSDSGEIRHPEAVGFLVRLGIMSGMEDGGYFAPTEHISRAQAARMATLIMTGGDDAGLDTGDEPCFSDVKGHWAEAYIKFCFELGIVDGGKDGGFEPEDAITGLELVRLAERMLGYDADAYRLKGEGWAARVDDLARIMDPSLYEELEDMDMAAPVTRDDGAQIFFNTLRATPKRVVPSHNLAEGTVTWQYVDSTRSDGTPADLLWERFGIASLEELTFH